MSAPDNDTQAVTDDELHTARHLRLKMLQDPYRPAYHFATPEGLAMPFDPNGSVFWRGRHHMGYIYQERGVHYWGHVSSTDLLHWRHHQPMLLPTEDSPETGIFSGNAYLDRDGKRVLCMYHGCGVGNCIAWSDDADLETWHKHEGNPIVPNPEDPETADYTSWDPCGWIDDDTYYAVFGGKKNTVWKSTDMRTWERCGPFLAQAYPGIDLDEDISCPDFFRMGDKWVMVCISHHLGARYYVGEWKHEQLHPEYHEMMSYCDNEFFAPESYTDDRGRRILCSWVFDGRADAVREPSGWSGMMSLPRVMTLAADNRLLMAPADELASLRYNGVTSTDIAIPKDSSRPVPFDPVMENVLELEVEIDGGAATEFGLTVCGSPDGEFQTVIGYDRKAGALKIDNSRSGDWERVDKAVTGTPKARVESAPMKLAEQEPLKLRVYLDRCLVEVFANDGRLALSRVVYPPPGAGAIALYARGGKATAKNLRLWDLMPTNPY